MRPSPLVLLAFIALGFALIAVPLARLTWGDRTRSGGEPRPMAAALDEAGGVEGHVRVRFAHAPLTVTVTQDGREVAVFGQPEDPRAGQMEQTMGLRLTPEAVADLLVEARWPEGTPPTALGLEIEPDGYETRRGTVWVDSAAVTELMTFSWK